MKSIKKILAIAMAFVMLIGMLSAVTLVNAVSTEFHKMISTEQLVKNGHYIIVAVEGDTRYALSSDEAAGFSSKITLKGANALEADFNDNYVLHMKSDQKTGAVVKLYTADESVGLKLNDSNGVYHSSPADVTVAAAASGTWTIKSGNGALNWNGSAFSVNDSGSTFEIWTDIQAPATTRYTQLTSIDQLKDLYKAPFIMVLIDENGDRYAIGRKSSTDWLLPVVLDKDGGNSYIELVSENNNNFSFMSYEGITFATTSSPEVAGSYTFDYIQLGNSQRLYLPGPAEDSDNANISGSPFRTYKADQSNKVTIQSSPELPDNQFYLRGNGDSRWLLYSSTATSGYGVGRLFYKDKDTNEMTLLPDNMEKRVPIEIYADMGQNGGTNTVQFMGADGKEMLTYTVNDSVTLLRHNTPIDPKDGYEYFFIGWSANSQYKGNPYLTIEQSSNLYGDEDRDSKDTFLKKARDLGLLGEGNPESPYTIDLADIPEFKNGNLTLYPVYAVCGFDGVVTANIGNTPIVGVSDWKADEEGELRYQDPTRERWLGSIDVEIYLDGEIWTNTTLYFSYHNDNAADLNIKFVWNDIVNKNFDGDLYDYMRQYNYEDFPIYDQLGHFVVDGVYATQGGSQKDQLLYKLNWMTDHGGQLDNVRGGEPVKLYMTTKYNVEYYLNDELITKEAWTNPNYYTTEGTKKAFATDIANAKYAVTEVNERSDLMNYTPDNEDGFTDDEEIVRGEFRTFAYDLHTSNNVIPIAKAPKELVADGQELLSKTWSLKNKNGKEVETVEWDANYRITGGVYGTGNTVNAYKNTAASTYDADDAYTYHLYAYTGVPSPKTGDTNNYALWLALMIISLLGMGVVLVLYKVNLKGKCKN